LEHYLIYFICHLHWSNTFLHLARVFFLNNLVHLINDDNSMNTSGYISKNVEVNIRCGRSS